MATPARNAPKTACTPTHSSNTASSIASTPATAIWLPGLSIMARARGRAQAIAIRPIVAAISARATTVKTVNGMLLAAREGANVASTAANSDHPSRSSMVAEARMIEATGIRCRPRSRMIRAMTGRAEIARAAPRKRDN